MMASFSAHGDDFPIIALIVPQLGRVGLVIQRLHLLAPCLPPMIIRCFWRSRRSSVVGWAR